MKSIVMYLWKKYKEIFYDEYEKSIQKLEANLIENIDDDFLRLTTWLRALAYYFQYDIKPNIDNLSTLQITTNRRSIILSEEKGIWQSFKEKIYLLFKTVKDFRNSQ